MTERLRDILEECEFLQRAVARMTLPQFVRDETARRAFVRSFEVIGEATKSVPQPVRDLAPEIPRKRMAGMRDRLVHAYDYTDYELVWRIAEEMVPELRCQITALLEHSALQD